MIIGYARVSTSSQGLSIQQERLEKEGKCSRLFVDQCSGTTRKREALQDCLDFVRDGDVLVITKIDRLARSQRDLHNLVHELENKGVILRVLDQPIDTSTPAGKAFLGMLGIFAEFETNLRKERQLEGIEKAKAQGKYKGRKATAREKLPEIKKLLAQGMTKQAVADQLKIAVSSVYNALKTERQSHLV